MQLSSSRFASLALSWLGSALRWLQASDRTRSERQAPRLVPVPIRVEHRTGASVDRRRHRRA